jgi:hypothetical protein
MLNIKNFGREQQWRFYCSRLKKINLNFEILELKLFKCISEFNGKLWRLNEV